MIKSKEHLEGMVDVFIHLYDEHQNSIPEELGLGFDILEYRNVFRVKFTWITGYTKKDSVNFSEPIMEDDWFEILKDESITKLEQYVSDCLFKVSQTDLDQLAA